MDYSPRFFKQVTIFYFLQMFQIVSLSLPASNLAMICTKQWHLHVPLPGQSQLQNWHSTLMMKKYVQIMQVTEVI